MSNFLAEISMAIMFFIFRDNSIAIADMPIPPRPITTTEDFKLTLISFMTIPAPVGSAQPNKIAVSKPKFLGFLISLFSDTTE